MINSIKEILKVDWVDFVCEKYKKIPEIDRKIFWILFASVNLMFIFHTINFLWGQNDWNAVKTQCDIDSLFYEGRFGANLLKNIFFQGQLLPIVNNVFAFLGLVLGAISLFKYWELDTKVKYFVVAGLIFTCSPFTSTWLSYISLIIEHFWAILFVVLGLRLAITSNVKDGLRFYINNIFSIFFLLLSISIYQPCINTIFVVLFAKLFIKAFEGKFKELLYIFNHSIFNIIVSILLIVLIYNLNNFGFIILDTNLIFTNIQNALVSIYTEFFSYEKFMMPVFVTILFLIITIVAIFVCLAKLVKDNDDKVKKIMFSIIFFLLMLISTQIAQIFVYYNVFHQTCSIFYGSFIFKIFMLVLILKYANVNTKTFTYFICFIIFMESLVLNFVSQKSFSFATTSELYKLNRIVTRIEQHPDFIADKDYNLIVIGEISETRPNFAGQFRVTVDWSKANYLSIISPRNPQDAISFYFPDMHINNTYVYYYDIDNKEIDEIVKKHIGNLKSWPAKDCLAIDGDNIIIALNNDSLQDLKNTFAEGK